MSGFGGGPAQVQGDVQLVNPPNDTISYVKWSPNAHLVAASSWNKEVRVWQVMQQGRSKPVGCVRHDAPVLCCDWSADGRYVFSGGCDKVAKMWDVNQNKSKVVAKHDAPIKCARWIPQMNLLLTGSWDRTLRYWDLRQQRPAMQVALPERCYTLDVTHPLLVVGTADRHVLIYDLKSAPKQHYERRQSPLKFQTRTIANFKDLSGFAIGSIEGRVAVQYIKEDASRDRKNFAFKCHREGDEVYSVNHIAFHPYGTFATCGSNGSYIFWDSSSKQRLKLFGRAHTSITCGDFSSDGRLFAYAASYDWSKGPEYAGKQPHLMYLHAVVDAEIRPRPKS